MKTNYLKLFIIFVISLILLSGCWMFTMSADDENNDGGKETPKEIPVPTPDDIAGFFVKDGKLYDANGYQFQMKGVNVNHHWNASGRQDESLAYESIPYIKATGANAVRIVFGPTENDPWRYQCMSTEARRAVVEEYIKYKIVPVVEYHNATGLNDPAKLNEAVDFWIGEKEWLDDLARYVIVNITNEWAKPYANTENGVIIYPASSVSEWAAEYKKAIVRLRNAGIKNLLVVDSFDYANKLTCILDNGQSIIDEDPMHNIMFSIHAYGGWYSSQTTGVQNRDGSWNADHALTLLEDKKITAIFGEFNREHTLSVGLNCAPDNELIDDFNKHKAGWIFWMWWNTGDDMVNQSDSFSYSYGGKTVSDKMKSSIEATIFPNTPVPALPVIDPPDPNWDPGPAKIAQRFLVDIKDNDGNVIGTTSYWQQVEFDRNIEAGRYVEMEYEDGRKILFAYAGWGNAFFAAMDESEFQGQNARFWIYASNGSIAKTEFTVIEYEKDLTIDLN